LQRNDEVEAPAVALVVAVACSFVCHSSLLLPAFLFVILRCCCLLFCLSFRSAAEESAVSRRRYRFVSRLHEQHSGETRSSTHIPETS
jgi:hypothetical protein